jgi:hypothetical protein
MLMQLHHLASCGFLLGSVVDRPLSVHQLWQVRTTLIAMADLLSYLEAALGMPADISNNLREHVPKIEDFLHRSRADSPSLPSELIDPSTLFDGPFELPQEQQTQLQTDLMTGWPMDMDRSMDWLNADTWFNL